MEFIGGVVTEMKRGIDRSRATRIAANIITAAIKVGLYAGAVVISYRTVIRAMEIARARASFPGGEILTIPLIIALFLVGWALRGDFERVWRRHNGKSGRRRNGTKK